MDALITVKKPNEAAGQENIRARNFVLDSAPTCQKTGNEEYSPKGLIEIGTSQGGSARGRDHGPTHRRHKTQRGHRRRTPPTKGARGRGRRRLRRSRLRILSRGRRRQSRGRRRRSCFCRSQNKGSARERSGKVWFMCRRRGRSCVGFQRRQVGRDQCI